MAKKEKVIIEVEWPDEKVNEIVGISGVYEYTIRKYFPTRPDRSPSPTDGKPTGT